jgi:hypothetical protein
MATDEEYDYSEESSSFLSNIRRNLNIITINEYMMFILAGFTILLLSGLIFVLAETPEIIHTDQLGLRIIFNWPPQVQDQTFNPSGLDNMYVFEMLLVAGILSLGTAGLYLNKNATSYIDDQKKALEILTLGVILFILAASLLFFIYIYKMTGKFPYFVGLG